MIVGIGVGWVDFDDLIEIGFALRVLFEFIVAGGSIGVGMRIFGIVIYSSGVFSKGLVVIALKVQFISLLEVRVESDLFFSTNLVAHDLFKYSEIDIEKVKFHRI